MDADRLSCIEYESLYKEIDKHSDRVFLIINADILLVTTILGLVPSLKPETMCALGSVFSTRSLFFLLPLVILLPSFVLVTASLNSTARIAAYILVCFEEKTPGIAWQRAMQFIREVDKFDKKADLKQFLRQSLRRLVKKEEKAEPTRFLLKGLRLILGALATLCIVLSVVSAIDLIVHSWSVERSFAENVSSLPYMLILWAISLWIVVTFTKGLGRTWKWKYFDDYAKLLRAKLQPLGATGPGGLGARDDASAP